MCPPYYPEWQAGEGYSSARYRTEQIDGATIHRCPLYIPKTVTTAKRLLHLFSFAISSGVRLFSLCKQKYDVVFLVQPTFFCAPLTLLFCKLTGTKAVMHIQDYELDAMLGLGLANNNFFTRSLKKVERWYLKRFDMVSSISYSMLELARHKGVGEEKLLFFPNWTNTDFVTPDTPGQIFRKNHGFSEQDKLVLYAGNMGHKQGLEIILESARTFTQQTDVKFVMVGAGAYVETLKSLAQQYQLTNVFFLPLQEWEDVPAMLATADIHLVVQKRGAADVVLPSKLTNILAAGGDAIITAEPETELGKLCEKFNGIYNLIEPESSHALTAAINEELAVERTGHNQVARLYAEKHLQQDTVLSRFITELRLKLGINQPIKTDTKKSKLDPLALLEDDKDEVLNKLP
ncbi:WcaI family glycosyltransferase [Salinimonas marina]|uniref:WcaI family glycosyltransferase n=1 Tax=Salinimonas marina TaxID=2785918 RepID=UPI001E291C2F|nr:WcaI family glycosyltransferase [Salinimonas marina]